MNKKLVYVDTDVGLGTPGAEIDDGAALIFLLRNKLIDIVGAGSVFGNISLHDAALNLDRLLTWLGGEHIPLGFGAERPLIADTTWFESWQSVYGKTLSWNSRPVTYLAANLIIHTIRTHPGQVSIISLGPMTNLDVAHANAVKLNVVVFEILGMENDKPDRPDARDAPSLVQEIRFENVEFAYREGQPVVGDFSLTVPGGSVVALVGRSGAGKTTVTDLVARFHDPTQGRILVNGTDIRDFRLRTYRDLLAIVQQEVFLFDGSVRDNIAYGRRHATDAEVEDAARRATAHEVIAKLPDQYETFVGERGVKLSGGQQQRLAIARAVLASPQILILDEATSNLDTESEQLIQASMATLLAGRTTFVIAHRLSTIRRADLILLMENGRVIERGNHEQLMNARGDYYRMVLRQMESHGHEGEEVLRS